MVSEVEDVPPPRPQQRGQLGVVTPAVDPQLGPCNKLIYINIYKMYRTIMDPNIANRRYLLVWY